MREVLAALLLGLLVGTFAGWKASSWRTDSVNLAVKEAADAIRQDAQQRESDIARTVLEGAQAAAPAERIIDRGVIREIQKTEYRNVCFGDDLVRLLNEGARGTPAVPGEPLGHLPR